MGSESKRNIIDQPSSRGSISSQAAKRPKLATSIDSSAIPLAQASKINLDVIQEAKKYVVAQAQRDGCSGNFKIFDSPFGNFLLPVVPSRAELGG